MEGKLYCIASAKLDTVPYQFTQACHAGIQFCLDNPEHPWKNDTIVFLEGPKSGFGRLLSKLEKKGIEYTKFREPDLDNQLTAFACFTDGKVFSKLKLLGT